MSEDALSEDSLSKGGSNDGGSRDQMETGAAVAGVFKRLWAYYVSNVPLVFKVLMLTLTVGASVGLVIDHIQAKNTRQAALAVISAELKSEMLETRALMDNYIKSYGQAVDMLARQAVFIDYVKGLNKKVAAGDTSAGEKNAGAHAAVKYHDDLPPWLLDTLAPKILLQARYLILLGSAPTDAGGGASTDAGGRASTDAGVRNAFSVREVYRTVSGTLPDVLIRPSAMLLELGRSQSYITELNGIPCIVKAGIVEDRVGSQAHPPFTGGLRGVTPLGVLLAVTPLDENFMSDFMSVRSDKKVIYALVRHTVKNSDVNVDAGGRTPSGELSAAEKERLQIIATNRSDLIPVGVTLSGISDKYIMSGKAFFDYGFSDILMGFVIFKNAADVETAVRDRVSGGRKRRVFLAAAIILSILTVMLWQTYRVRELNRRLSEFSWSELGRSGVLGGNLQEIHYGDDLYSLNARFSALMELIVSTNAEMWKNLSELENSEKRFRAISETALGAIMMMDGKGLISYWNKAAERIFGYTAHEALGRNLHELIVPLKYREPFSAGFEKFRQTGQGNAIGRTLELTALRKNEGDAIPRVNGGATPGVNGDATPGVYPEFPVELSISGIEIDGQWQAVGMARDISQRKRFENALKESRDELEDRVRLRTAELTVTNEKLSEEMLQRAGVQEMLQRNYDMQDITGKVLHLSMESITLEEQLERTLDLILSVKWLSLDGKGSISLVDIDAGGRASIDAGDRIPIAGDRIPSDAGGRTPIAGDRIPELVMKAQRGLGEVLLGKCKKIPFGACLCGRAALERKVVFADCLDERHSVMYPGIPPHGHYCVPILSGANVLGVVNMYVKEGHKRELLEEDFLTAVANTLSGVIERKRIEDELVSFNELLHTLIDNIPDSIYFKDINNRFVMINKAKSMHSKTVFQETIGKTDYDFLPEEQARQSFMDDEMVKNTGKSINGKIEKVSRRDGGDVWLSVVKIPWRDKNGRIIGTMGISRDITTLKNTEETLRKKERQLAYMAHHDALTGLPNRLLFDDRLRQTLAYARRYKQLFAVMFLDLDKFKNINDTLGHDCGDDLLRTVAKRLENCVRESDTVARMGGDEFMILLIDAADGGGAVFATAALTPTLTPPIPPVNGGESHLPVYGGIKGGHAGLHPKNLAAGEGDASRVNSPIEGFEIVARKIIAAFEEGFTLAGERRFITTSIGISLFPQDIDAGGRTLDAGGGEAIDAGGRAPIDAGGRTPGGDVDTLVKKADIALYNAKESGRNNYKFYSPAMENKNTMGRT